MIWLLYIALFAGMATLLAIGGINYHQIENELRRGLRRWW